MKKKFKVPENLTDAKVLAKELNIAYSNLVYWSDHFELVPTYLPGCLVRFYTPEQCLILRQIKYLIHSLGFTLKGARSILNETTIFSVLVKNYLSGLKF